VRNRARNLLVLFTKSVRGVALSSNLSSRETCDLLLLIGLAAIPLVRGRSYA
jgi:hypothetical protein